METSDDVRRVIADLTGGVWALAALTAALEVGLLESATEQPDVQSGLGGALLDVLAAVRLVEREGERCRPAPGLLPLLGAPGRDYLVRDLRAAFLQCAALVDGARRGTLQAGWQATDPTLIEAVGAGSNGAPAARLLSTRLFPTLEGLVERLATPDAAFLDVGTGVGALAVEMCHLWPQLRVVGLEPQEAPLAAARLAVATAGLDGRVELRRQRVEEMVDSTAFDLVWLPQVFLSQEALVGALPRVLRALRPGGWLLALVLGTPGVELRPALGRLIDVLWGGDARFAGEVESLAAAAGFGGVHTVAGPQGGLVPAAFVAARRPL
jgi:SAM-dependent methyltransferase